MLQMSEFYLQMLHLLQMVGISPVNAADVVILPVNVANIVILPVNVANVGILPVKRHRVWWVVCRHTVCF